MEGEVSDVLQNGIVDHDGDIEGPQTPQAMPALDGMTRGELRTIALDMKIPVAKDQDEGALIRMIRAEHPRPVGLQPPTQPAELNQASISQSSRLEPPGSRPNRSPSPTAMAGQITMTPEELSMLVRHEVKKTLVRLGASEETISKAVDDDWAFADEETEQTGKTNAGSTVSSASDEPAAEEKTPKGTQCTTSTQGNAEDPKVQKFQVKLAELRKMLDEKKTEVFEPKFEDASGEIEIQLPPNVKDLDHWGTALVQQGKYQGQSYKTAFDNEIYRKWLMDNFGSLKAPAIVDLAKYVICKTKAEMAKADA